jgi:hypothetical protein
MSVGLGARRLPGESWRQCVERYSKRYGLERECLEDYDQAIASDQPEESAAWSALYNWDVLDLMSGDHDE